jgi:50S ribosomal protein L16 3-hydroxylase
MLYLPPGFAHDGIAETESLTWSIGFRAPSAQELSVAMLDYLRDDVAFEGEYRDPDLIPSRNPGAIDSAMTDKVTMLLAPMRAAAGDTAHIKRCLGRMLTEPKSHVFFDAPEPALTIAKFRVRALSHGVELDLRSRLLYDSDMFYFNGTELKATPFDTMYLRQLADTRRLPPGVLAIVADSLLLTMLFDAYREGWLQLT